MRSHLPSQYRPGYSGISVEGGVSHQPSSISELLNNSPSRGVIQTPASRKYSPGGASGEGSSAASDASLLLGLNPAYPHVMPNVSSNRQPPSYPIHNPAALSRDAPPPPPPPPYDHSSRYSLMAQPAPPPPPAAASRAASQMPAATLPVQPHPPFTLLHPGDVLIESQDIDMNSFQEQGPFSFSINGELIPWLEYLPQDVLNYFGEHTAYPTMSPDDTDAK